MAKELYFNKDGSATKKMQVCFVVWVCFFFFFSFFSYRSLRFCSLFRSKLSLPNLVLFVVSSWGFEEWVLGIF
jgi:hypothetical protein